MQGFQGFAGDAGFRDAAVCALRPCHQRLALSIPGWAGGSQLAENRGETAAAHRLTAEPLRGGAAFIHLTLTELVQRLGERQ
jgi:hypothetical protein